MKIPAFFMILLIFIIPVAGFSQTKVFDRDIQYEQLLRDPDFPIDAPLILNDSIIFFFTKPAKRVVVAGDFNNWRPVLLMEKIDENFHRLVWDKRLPKGRYRYKLMVDDIWISDPNNTNFVLDNAGQRVSYFDLEEEFIPNRKYPLRMQGNRFAFRFTDTSAKRVALVGSFNNWNPYSHPMKYLGAGVFEITIPLRRGFHTYCFVVDDNWTSDPNNLNQYSDEAGNIINLFYVDTD
jgi:1,4-alpha-glucan branching enzyme